ncbi:transcriptional regulator [Vibrio sp. NTOU-M3]|uniref:winged helix-turn-helix domain-containing protein n=1 Tax=Vibrio sp. NTOU-M3 TaxID=3234954 RepID=UPI00349F65D7
MMNECVAQLNQPSLNESFGSHCSNITCVICPVKWAARLRMKVFFDHKGKPHVSNLDGTEVMACSLNSIRCLCYLSDHIDELVSRDDLEIHIWNSVLIGRSRLPVLLHEVRKILNFSNMSLITVRNKGYTLRNWDCIALQAV